MSTEKFAHLFGEKTKVKVLKKLHSIDTAVKRIEYWYENGLRWLELSDSTSIAGLELEPFKFEIPPAEYAEVNQWIIDNFLPLAWGTKEEKLRRFLDFDELRAAFERDYKKRGDKRLIQEELKRINKSFEVRTGGFLRQRITSVTHYENMLFYADYNAFENSKEYDDQPDYSSLFPSVGNVLMARNGYILGQFHNYLKARLTQPVEVELKEGDMPQKLLLLHYLGLLDVLRQKLPSQNKQAKILQAILGAHPDNIEDKLTALKPMDERIRKRKNFEFVTNALDKVDLFKEAEEARKVLDAIYKTEVNKK